MKGRARLVEESHPELSLRTQCKLLGVARSTLDYQPVKESAEDLQIKRWMDNVFIERLWRSVKYEEIYLREHSTLPALEMGLRRWFQQYNTWRPHQALGNRTPYQVHQEDAILLKEAA